MLSGEVSIAHCQVNVRMFEDEMQSQSVTEAQHEIFDNMGFRNGEYSTAKFYDTEVFIFSIQSVNTGYVGY
jgi:hypothetical protein